MGRRTRGEGEEQGKEKGKQKEKQKQKKKKKQQTIRTLPNSSCSIQAIHHD